MEHPKLGNTDIEVSALCLGTMIWGGQNTEAEAHAQIEAALKAGINFIDNAEMYPTPMGGTLGAERENPGELACRPRPVREGRRHLQGHWPRPGLPHRTGWSRTARLRKYRGRARRES